MLRLRTQAIHRLGKVHTCPSCLAAIRPSVAASGRSNNITSSRLVHSQTKNRLFTTSASLFDADAPKDVPEGSEPSSEPAKKKASKPKAKKKKKKSPSKPTADKNASVSTEQQLTVLQGALAALKKVLEQQNIHYEGTKAVATKEKPPQKKPKKGSQKEAKTQSDQEPQETLAEATASPAEKLGSEATPEAAATAPGRGSKSSGRKPRRPKTSAKEKQDAQKNEDSELDAALFKNGVQIGALQKGLEKRRRKHPDAERELKSKPSKDARNASSEKPGVRKVKSKLLIRNVPSDLDGQALNISKINADEVDLVPIDKPQPPVASLSYGLDRALFNPGVYHLQDPRSKVFNFDPYLANIMPTEEFDFDALQQYITSSKDENLIGVAREHGKKYTGSTSSMTAVLSHFHYLLSSWREINSGMMSQEFEVPSKNFTALLRSPAATFLHYKDGVYAIDADKEFDSANILSMLGKSMEKLLTLPKEEYEKYRRVNSHQISEEERNADEAYHYTGLGDFMMRSQLDAYDPRVPGTGMFDLKTRAVISIRMDVRGYEKGLGYELRHRHGNWESYEREYHDMIRAAFLKYSLQVRMGRMDGIFVAFHNTQRIFGFQYIPLSEMDLSLHGTTDTALGDKEFKLSLTLLNQLLDRATEKFPEQSLRLFVETRPSNTPFMYAFVKPVTPEEIEMVQNKNKASVEMVENKLRGITDSTVPEASEEAEIEGRADEAEVEELTNEAEAVEEQRETELEEGEEEDEGDDVVSWDEIQLMVEDAMEDDELGIGAVRQAIEEALEESGLLEVQSPEEARGYVDALLSAVTGGSQQATAESTNLADDEAQATSEPEATEVETAAPITTEAETVESENTGTVAAESEQTEAKPGQTPEEVAPQESPAEEILGESETKDAETKDSDGESTSPNMSTLSSLIVRMTRKIDEKGTSEEQPDATVSSKLKEFERVLSKIISESRDDDQTAGIDAVQGATDEALDSADKTAAETTADEAPTESVAGEVDSKAEAENQEPILGMVLTVRNKIDGKYVTRPEKLTKDDEWEVEYNIEELPTARAHRLFQSCQKRRRTAYKFTGRDAAWKEMFEGALPKYTQRGRDFRMQEEEEAKKRPIHVVGQEKPSSYQEVFGRHDD
jgi:hypothetical protein